jgi:hypothetical protein
MIGILFAQQMSDYSGSTSSSDGTQVKLSATHEKWLSMVSFPVGFHLHGQTSKMMSLLRELRFPKLRSTNDVESLSWSEVWFDDRAQS